MRIPVVAGLIKRRLLVNFRADPEVVQRLLPNPFRPKLQAGQAVVGVCLIRLEHLRPAALPALAGFSSENAAHRIAVQWKDAQGADQEGVFIPRRDTDAVLNRLAGGRFFPGEHHAARFSVTERNTQIDFIMKSVDGLVSIQVSGTEADSLPPDSCFASLDEASAFFERGSLGYSATKDNHRLDGLMLRTFNWQVRPLEVAAIDSSFFSDPKYFPQSSIEFDHALIMRNLRHEWRPAQELKVEP